MDFLIAIFLFSFGAVLASFLNLCVYRIEKKESVKGIFVGRSFCENCRKGLEWYELVPIFSFLFLKGKCSTCKKKIGFFNIVSEFLLGLFFLLFWILNIPIYFFLLLIILYFFAVYDFHYRSIPKSITDVVLIFSFLYWFALLLLDYDINRVIPVVILLFLSFLLLVFSRKKTLFGLGDVFILAILAFWIEVNLFLPILFLSFVIGGLFSLALVVKNKAYLKKYIPFIPFVFFGFVFASLLHYAKVPLFDYMLAIW
jgi:leader peptidase (prepilin peptidase) / N-methyltransferase